MTPPVSRPVPRLDRVVVAVDFSEPSILAATWIAQHFARGAEIVLTHVIHIPTPPAFLEGRYSGVEQLVETARAGAELRLRELAAPIATGLVWTEIRVGAPDEEIVRVAEEYRADLIVVGRPAPRPGIWGRLGTTAQRVLRRAAIPVLLAAGMPQGPPARVLVGVDDSEMTGPVVDWARLVTERFDADTVVMHVVQPLPFYAGAPLPGEPVWGYPHLRDDTAIVDDASRGQAERWIAAQLGASPRAQGQHGRLTPAVAEGLPANVLLAEAARRESELLIVGSRGAGAARRLILGSVAESVLRDSPCPALVVT